MDPLLFDQEFSQGAITFDKIPTAVPVYLMQPLGAVARSTIARRG